MTGGTLDIITGKLGLNLDAKKMPIEIPGVGREWLAGLFAELGFKAGAEIGVQCGVYSEILCKANPGVVLYCIDSWRAYPDYQEHVSQSWFDRFYDEAQRRLAPYDCEFVRQFSMEAVQSFRDESLDFVYLDANHSFKHVTDDIREWSRKVKVGGIVSGHDYVRRKNILTHMQVIEAVQAYTKTHQISPWFILGSYGMRPGQVRDKNRSWMWVKA